MAITNRKRSRGWSDVVMGKPCFYIVGVSEVGQQERRAPDWQIELICITNRRASYADANRSLSGQSSLSVLEYRTVDSVVTP
jgi:hypothetical protein